MKKILKRNLDLNKKVISNLNAAEAKSIKGGQAELWGTRALCFSSDASNCTNSSCARTTGVLVCIPL